VSLLKSPKSVQIAEKQLTAAMLLADGELPLPEIARKAGTTAETIREWMRKDTNGFRSQVQQFVDIVRECLIIEGIGNKSKRVARLNDEWRSLIAIVQQRRLLAEEKVKNGEQVSIEERSGLYRLVTRQYRSHTSEEWVFDADLSAALRALELQAARELGQVQGDGGVQILKAYVNFDPEDAV
jgi:hypothetical protein